MIPSVVLGESLELLLLMLFISDSLIPLKRGLTDF